VSLLLVKEWRVEQRDQIRRHQMGDCSTKQSSQNDRKYVCNFKTKGGRFICLRENLVIDSLMYLERRVTKSVRTEGRVERCEFGMIHFTSVSARWRLYRRSVRSTPTNGYRFTVFGLPWQSSIQVWKEWKKRAEVKKLISFGKCICLRHEVWREVAIAQAEVWWLVLQIRLRLRLMRKAWFRNSRNILCKWQIFIKY